MTETNPTPAEAIPIALVNDAGHLTGKPAEGVTAMIQAATEDLKAKLTEATKAGIDEAAVEKIITDHEADILKAWQADPTFAQMSSSFTKQVFAGKNDSERPSDLWLYLLTAVAAGIEPSQALGAMTQVSSNSSDYDAVDSLMLPAEERESTNEDESPSALYEWLAAYHAFASAVKLHSVDSLRVDGNRLKIVAGDRTGYIPITWEA